MFLPWAAWVVSQASAKRSASAPCFSMTSSGIDGVPLHLRHLLALLVGDDGVQVHRPEGDLLHEVQARHHHAGHPEEEDVVAGHQHAWSGRTSCSSRVSSGQPSVANGHSQDENQVSSTSSSWRSSVPPHLPQAAGRRARHGDVGAGAAVPGRDAVAPPQLARDAPVADVAHPVEVGLRPALGDELGLALLDRLDGRLGQRLHLHEPLGARSAARPRCRSAGSARPRARAACCRARAPAPSAAPSPPCGRRSDPARRTARPRR